MRESAKLSKPNPTHRASAKPPRLIGLVLSILALVGCTPVGVVNSVSQKPVAKNIAYGPLERQVLDVYVPNRSARGKPFKTATGTGQPVMVFVHGGSWRNGDKNDYQFIGDAFAREGFVTLVISYRLAPKVQFPGFVEDAALAVKWAKDKVKHYGGDPERLYLMGHSAGAHIAALVALDPTYLAAQNLQRSSIRAFVGLSGPYDFLEFLKNDPKTQEAMGPKENWARTQPVNMVDGKQPPMLLMQGLNDDTVDPRHPLWLQAKVQERGGEVEVKRYAGVDHPGMVGAFSKVARFLEPKAMPDLLEYLKRH